MTASRDRLVMSLKEYAERMGLTEKAARQQVARRLIPFRRIGGRIVISVTELELFLQRLPGVTVEEALERAADMKD
jgi:hypothetical protein